MRAASKVAGGIGAGVIHGGLRGTAAVPPVEQSVRKSSVPVSAIMTSLSSASTTAKATVHAADVAGVHRPVWDMDDWEFAGDEDELVMAAGEPLPRVVFAGVPSFNEAKEATVELKDALDKYASNPNYSPFFFFLSSL